MAGEPVDPTVRERADPTIIKKDAPVQNMAAVREPPPPASAPPPAAAPPKPAPAPVSEHDFDQPPARPRGMGWLGWTLFALTAAGAGYAWHELYQPLEA